MNDNCKNSGNIWGIRNDKMLLNSKRFKLKWISDKDNCLWFLTCTGVDVGWISPADQGTGVSGGVPSFPGFHFVTGIVQVTSIICTCMHKDGWKVLEATPRNLHLALPVATPGAVSMVTIWQFFISRSFRISFVCRSLFRAQEEHHWEVTWGRGRGACNGLARPF